MKRRIIWCFGLAVLACLILGIAGYSVLLGEDRFSNGLRTAVEMRVNQKIYQLSYATANDTLSPFDKRLVKAVVAFGITFGRRVYPEAAQVLSHYIDGEGQPLALPSNYFQKSPYLNLLIKGKKDGVYGPFAFHQKSDWRLSLALNPFYFAIKGGRITLYHPKVQFAHARDNDVYTAVPIGKLKIVFYDNIISALNPTPFYVFSEWPHP